MEPVDSLDLDSEADLLARYPGLYPLLTHYQVEGKPGWVPRRRLEDLNSREEQRLHALALAEGWLEPSGGNPDAPEDLRVTACYRLTRTGKSALQKILETAA